jgi:hypothetical protein
VASWLVSAQDHAGPSVYECNAVKACSASDACSNVQTHVVQAAGALRMSGRTFLNPVMELDDGSGTGWPACLPRVGESHAVLLQLWTACPGNGWALFHSPCCKPAWTQLHIGNMNIDVFITCSAYRHLLVLQTDDHS